MRVRISIYMDSSHFACIIEAIYVLSKRSPVQMDISTAEIVGRGPIIAFFARRSGHAQLQTVSAQRALTRCGQRSHGWCSCRLKGCGLLAVHHIWRRRSESKWRKIF